MSFLFAQPEMLGAAATDLASIGSAISTANAAAAAATTRVLAAGADEVSAAVAALFSGHAQTYQALSTQAAAFHQQIVQTLTSTAGAYASAEAANVEQQLLGAINAPTMALLGRPLIGHGADGAPGTGQAGGPAGSCTATAATAGPAHRSGRRCGRAAGLIGHGGAGGLGGTGASVAGGSDVYCRLTDEPLSVDEVLNAISGPSQGGAGAAAASSILRICRPAGLPGMLPIAAVRASTH